MPFVWLAAAEENSRRKQASSGGSLLSICNSRRGSLYRTSTLSGIYIRNFSLRVWKISGNLLSLKYQKEVVGKQVDRTVAS